jgi:tetratricopeptide (TPR) repeat protein
MLAVDDCRHDPDCLFASAQAAEEAGDIAEAGRFYRTLMKGNDPSAAFNLGNMLRACGRNVEAEAALHAATGIDLAFAEAWYNLGDLLDDQGRSEAAIESLRKAVQVAPDYSDAMFNLALLLQQKNQCAEAADYWRRYLAIDGRSEWASRARRSLKFREMQQHLIV